MRRAVHRLAAPAEQAARSVLPALGSYETYDQLYQQFRWRVPKYFNIAHECCDYWHERGFGKKLAIVEHSSQVKYSFSDLSMMSMNLAGNLMQLSRDDGCEIKVGDRMAVLLSQSVNTAVAHLAIFKLGCISVPLFTLFGADALHFRLRDSGAMTLVTDLQCLHAVLPLCGQLPMLRYILVVAEGQPLPQSKRVATLRFEDFLINAPPVTVRTKADDPAMIIYTSGTTGNPKGCLHAHRVLLGHLPGIELPHNRFVQTCDSVVFWTPADWAWIGGLFDVLFPSLYYGVTTVSHRMSKFNVHESLEVMRVNKVTNAFLPPTAIKLMKSVAQNQGSIHLLHSIGSGGETLGSSLMDFGLSAFGTRINEFYGQTECNLLVSNSDLFPIKDGSMGRPICGKVVKILDEITGIELGANEVGMIAVESPIDGGDPAQFLGYWNLPQKTEEKFVVSGQRRYMVTGDLGKTCSEGYLFFIGRDDDVITTGGYRCGPSEIEEACLKHPEIALAAAIGKPCALRGELIKAFLVLKEPDLLLDPSRCEEISQEVKELVKTLVGKHEYPREVEFVEKLHMTITGKVQRRQHRLDEEKSIT